MQFAPLVPSPDSEGNGREGSGLSETPLELGLGAGLPADRLLDLDLVSAGGQGLLYRARDAALDRTVAVKILTSEQPGTAVAPSVAAQARMSWHRNVMSLYDVGRTTAGHIYLVMEFVEGGSCDQLRRRGPVPIDRTLGIGLELAEALQACHERDIVHCDVKPSNVMLDTEGHVRLGDFGLARRIDRTATTLAEIQGSLMYVAPETLEGIRPGKPADVYALALTIRAMLTGEQPWAEARTLGEAIATRLQTRRLSFDELLERPRLRHALEAATDSDPERRPLLPELIAELRIAAGREAPPVTSPPTQRRGRRVIYAAGAACLLVGGIVGYVVRPTTSTPPAPSRQLTQREFCGALLQARAQLPPEIHKLTTRLDENPQRNSDSVGAVRMMVSDYPRLFARINRPVVDAAARDIGLSGPARSLSPDALGDMAVVDGLYRVDDPARGLIDSNTFEVNDRPGLDGAVRRTALNYATLMKFGQEHCSTEEFANRSDEVGKAIATFGNRLVSYLQSATVMGPFFAPETAPRSARLFTPRQVDLILSVSDSLIQQFNRNTVWVEQLLEDSAMRATVFSSHLDFVLHLLDDPARLAYLQERHPEWETEIRDRFDELPEWQRTMYRASFPAALAALDRHPIGN